MSGIEKISQTDVLNAIRKLESTQAVCKVDKQEFTQVVNNHATINMSQKEYKTIMQQRPLIKYRPARNSFIKKGDKALLAQGLGIDESNLDDYLKQIEANNFTSDVLVKMKDKKKKKVAETDITLSQ